MTDVIPTKAPIEVDDKPSQDEENPTVTMKRFDYAWDWFKVHDKQRTDMFNYFLITTALLANAYVQLRKENHWGSCLVVCLAGIVTAVGFFLLDVRNKFLVDKAAEVLEIIEEKTLFTHDKYVGLGLSQKRFDNTFPDKPRWVNKMVRHGSIFRSTHLLVMGLWVFLSVAAFVHRVTTPPVPATKFDVNVTVTEKTSPRP